VCVFSRQTHQGRHHARCVWLPHGAVYPLDRRIIRDLGYIVGAVIGAAARTPT
jgi:hypothetical protein